MGSDTVSGRAPLAPGSTGSADPSRPRLSLWVDHRLRHFRWEVGNGPISLTLPAVMTLAEIDDLEQVFNLVLKSTRRTALAIDARDSDGSGGDGETGTGSTEGDSAGPQDIAQTPAAPSTDPDKGEG